MIDHLTKDELKSNLLSAQHWQRLVYMLLFAVLLHVASLTMWVLIALQFLFALVTGKDNADLRGLGADITIYIHQALDFLTYNSEEKPFPFSAWAGGARSNEIEGELIEVKDSEPKE